MATARLTKRTVESVQASESDAYIWDTELTGFGVKVTPAGKRVYLVQYRFGGRKGRTRRVTIGPHGHLTTEQARQEAKRILGEVAIGTDVAELKSEARSDLTVAELCDLYLAEGCALKRPSTVTTDRRNIERHIKPLLGRLKVAQVKRADVERFQRDVASGKSAVDERTGPRGRARVTGGKGTAARSVAVLGAIFTFAVARELRPDNPVRGVKLFKGERKERFLSAAELARLGDALVAAEQGGTTSPYAIAAIRLLLLTGARKSEILTLRWEHVDFERKWLRLPQSKTGAKVIPLGSPPLELLADLPRQDGNPYVICGDKPGQHFVGLTKAWERIRERAELGGLRIHDLRHSFASVAVAGGDSLYLIGKVLGHKQARTTEIYAHLADDPLRAVADRTAGQIAQAMNSGKTDNVVPLRQNVDK